MSILILGDVHGRWDCLNIVIVRALKQCPDITHFIQVGDFGYAWPGNYIQADGTGYSKPFKLSTSFMDPSCLARAQAIPFHWLDGNHENHNKLDADGGAFQPDMIYQRRGSVVEFSEPFGRAMFFGGASSIDKAMRIEDKSWWRQESITYRQVTEALCQPEPINIVFSHEHPIEFPYRSYKDTFGKSDKQALDAVRDHFKPKFWVFGHHHDFGHGVTQGTEWACAPIIESYKAILWDGTELKLLDCSKRTHDD